MVRNNLILPIVNHPLPFWHLRAVFFIFYIHPRIVWKVTHTEFTEFFSEWLLTPIFYAHISLELALLSLYKLIYSGLFLRNSSALKPILRRDRPHFFRSGTNGLARDPLNAHGHICSGWLSKSLIGGLDKVFHKMNLGQRWGRLLDFFEGIPGHFPLIFDFGSLKNILYILFHGCLCWLQWLFNQFIRWLHLFLVRIIRSHSFRLLFILNDYASSPRVHHERIVGDYLLLQWLNLLLQTLYTAH